MQVVFVPQQAIAAPGSSLREQLSYPSKTSAHGERLLSLLRTVQLEHLLDRVSGDWDAPNDWAGTCMVYSHTAPLDKGTKVTHELCFRRIDK